MQVDADRLEFAPPPQPDLWRAFALAIIAHLLLLIALTWGIHWKREAENVTAEAELWSSVPQQAAPAVVQPPPPVVVQAPVVQAPPLPTPTPPEPEVKVAPPPPPPVQARKEPDIALEREKRKQEQAERRQEELERQKKLDARKKQDELKREQLAEKAAEKKAAEEKKKLEEQAKVAKTKKQQREDDKKMASLREEQMRRIQGLAGATGSPESKGAAQRSSGPSDSYGSRVRARVRPNIVFTDDISGNPTAEVEVRMAPDGTITSRRLIKSSGVKGWDEAVLRALDKTEVLPRDIDGRVPTPIIIEFRPKG